MSEYRATCIKRDRQGRVFMAVGPLWWWIAGMSLVVAAVAVAYELLEGAAGVGRRQMQPL